MEVYTFRRRDAFFFLFYFILLYNTVLVLPYINMNPPWVYTCPQSWTPLLPPSPCHLSGSSQCTSPKHPVPCIEPRVVICFLYDIIQVSPLWLQSVSQFSHSVVSDSLWPHGPQHTTPPRPSPSSRVHPNSCPVNWWCHPILCRSILLCLQSFPASGSFPISRFFVSGG